MARPKRKTSEPSEVDRRVKSSKQGTNSNSAGLEVPTASSQASQKASRFLSLPREVSWTARISPLTLRGFCLRHTLIHPFKLRDHIYSFVARDLTATLYTRGRGNLTCPAAITLVNKQIRSEVMSVLCLEAGSIVAEVVNFDFRHLVTFYNRLSEREHKHLLGMSQGQEKRHIVVRLAFTYGYSEYTAEDLLKRWVKRVAHPNKQGTEVYCSYEVAKPHHGFGTNGMQGWRYIRQLQHGSIAMKEGVQKEELDKVLAPVVIEHDAGFSHYHCLGV